MLSIAKNRNLRRPGIFLAIFVSLMAAGGVGLSLLRSSDPGVETLTLKHGPEEAPALCPWRQPDADRRLFFPGSTAAEKELLVLSRIRTQILNRLGPGVPLESNALYVYRIFRASAPIGAIAIRRTAGEYGAIEVVLAVGSDGRVIGARLQRLREPPAIAAAITSPTWLASFRGKTASDAWTLGHDLPQVPPVARMSAAAVLSAARSLLIEMQVAGQNTSNQHTAGTSETAASASAVSTASPTGRA